MTYTKEERKKRYKLEYKQQVARGEGETRMKRQEHRRDFDEKHTGKRTVKAKERAGKHLGHVSSLAASKSKNVAYRLEDPSKNMSNNYKKKGPMKKKKKTTRRT